MNVKTTKSCLKRQQGFSAPEAAIVVVIITILIVLAVPRVSRTVELRQLDTYVSVIANKMTETRTHAIKRNRSVWLEVDPINRTTQIQTTDAVGNTVNVKGSELFPATIGMAETTVVEFRFDSMGRLTTGNETVTFQMTNSGSPKTRAVSVGPAGKITVASMY